MQGLIVFAVVISYEAVRQWGLRRQQKRVGAELAAAARNTDKKEVAAR
jgi:simple sugar transport system permease protein